MTPHGHLLGPARSRLPAVLAALLLASAGCTSAPSPSGPESPSAGGPESSSAGGPEDLSTQGSGDAVTLMAAGDVAGSRADAAATGDLIRNADPDAVLALGDLAYPDGTAQDYAEKYDPAWGSFKDRTHPVPGNHDYHDDAAGYLDYFGRDAVTNDVDGGLYYAWDVGNDWRAYAVNTEIDTEGAQLAWLKDDVAAHPGMHYLLYTHHPRYTSGANHGPSTKVCPLWDALAATGGLEVVLAGHNHQYERFAAMDCDGNAGDDGAVSFVVGTGGNRTYDFNAAQRGSAFQNATDFGVLRLELYGDSFDWAFVAAGREETGARSANSGNAGEVLDSGSQAVN